MKPEIKEFELEITKNLNRIYNSLVGGGKIKPTAFSKFLGYSSTSQLNSTLSGEALISTKAILCLVKNLNINPTFLITGKGEMLLSDASEIETVKMENSLWSKKFDDAQKLINSLNSRIKDLEKRYDDLVELSSAGIKYYKERLEGTKEPVVEKKEEEEEEEEDNSPLNAR